MSRHRTWWLCGILIYWVVHFYLWGPFGWREFETFDDVWWFDISGHGIAGLGIAFTTIYVLRVYAMHGLMRVMGYWTLTLVVLGSTALWSSAWELLELIYDTFLRAPSMPMLQKSSMDTVLDVTAALTTSFVATLIYIGGNKYYEWQYPGLVIADELEDLGHRIEQASDRVVKMRGAVRREQLSILKRRFRNLSRRVAGKHVVR